MSENIQQEGVWIPVPENVLGGHPDSVQIMQDTPSNAIFFVNKMFQGPITIPDKKETERLVVTQVPGITLMVEPYNLKVAIERQEIHGDLINRILEELAIFVNADINIRYISKSMQRINYLIEKIGAGVGAIRIGEMPSYNNLKIITTSQSSINSSTNSPESILTQIQGNPAFGHLGREYQTRIDSLHRLRMMNVISIYSTRMINSGRPLSIFINKIIELEKNPPKNNFPRTYLNF